MPGVLKHITESLENIDARKDMPEKLLSTIRCPLNLKGITSCMPESKYASHDKKLADLQPDASKMSAMSQLKPMRDINVRDGKDKDSDCISSAESKDN